MTATEIEQFNTTEPLRSHPHLAQHAREEAWAHGILGYITVEHLDRKSLLLILNILKKSFLGETPLQTHLPLSMTILRDDYWKSWHHYWFCCG